MGGRVAQRSRRVTGEGRPPSPVVAPGDSPLAIALAALAAAALAAWVFRNAPSYGFSQDDWTALARAGGIAPPLTTAWRWLSQQAFWTLVLGPLQSSATAAHLLVLGAHALSAALLVLLLARATSAAAALAGGVFFATHFAQFTALYWLSAAGDVFAVLFALAAAHAFVSRAPWRHLAAPLLLLALLGKESVAGAPLVIGALALRPPVRARLGELARDPLAWTLAALSLGWALLVRPGGDGAALGGAAYALDARAVGANLLTYLGWTANAWIATVRDVSDRVSPREYGWAAALLAAWLAAAAHPALRRGGALAALVAFVALLAPVLPLASHTYHYYLVAALPAAAFLVALLLDGATAGRARPLRLPLAGALALALAVNGALLVERIETAPFRAPGLRADAIVDRALIAANAVEGLRGAGREPAALVRVWSPQSQSMAASEGLAPGRESYYESNLRAALAGGLALRVTRPGIRRVEFVSAFDPADSTADWAVCRYDGRLQLMTTAELALQLRQGPPR